ncbi:STAS domain-containing protein [Kitasatospora sp. CMC57]|uniref:Anti-sigma factor antagonist n=1 Tax=Kitasatospora sp. CMC57 TaxID=3231513 RepID=A0AB33JUT4_9ACTN
MDLKITFQQLEGWSVAHVEGELDIATTDELRRRLTDALSAVDGGVRLVVDLTRLDFCDASGLGALLAARETAERLGAKVRLAITEGRVLRVIRLTQLDRVLPVYPTVRAAVSATDAEVDALSFSG